MNLTDAIDFLRTNQVETPITLAPPTSEAAAQAEKQLGVTFHPDYRQFLMDASAICFGSLEPFTLHDAPYLSLIWNAENAWAHGLPKALLPFCPDNGNYFCIDSSGASPDVVYWDHNGKSSERWPDLAAWITEVWIGEYSPEEDGQKFEDE